MNPAEIPDALRNFAAAAELSPDPAKTVADLARLLAGLFDRALQQIAEEGDEPPAPGAAPLDHDELAFPPVDNLVISTNGGEFVQAVGHTLSEAELSELAREAAGLSPEAWAEMPAEELAVHSRLAELKVIAANTAAAQA